MAQHIYDILKVTPYIRHHRSQLGVCVWWGVEGRGLGWGGVGLLLTPQL